MESVAVPSNDSSSKTSEETSNNSPSSLPDIREFCESGKSESNCNEKNVSTVVPCSDSTKKFEANHDHKMESVAVPSNDSTNKSTEQQSSNILPSIFEESEYESAISEFSTYSNSSKKVPSLILSDFDESSSNHENELIASNTSSMSIMSKLIANDDLVSDSTKNVVNAEIDLRKQQMYHMALMNELDITQPDSTVIDEMNIMRKMMEPEFTKEANIIVAKELERHYEKLLFEARKDLDNITNKVKQSQKTRSLEAEYVQSIMVDEYNKIKLENELISTDLAKPTAECREEKKQSKSYFRTLLPFLSQETGGYQRFITFLWFLVFFGSFVFLCLTVYFPVKDTVSFERGSFKHVLFQLRKFVAGIPAYNDHWCKTTPLDWFFKRL